MLNPLIELINKLTRIKSIDLIEYKWLYLEIRDSFTLDDSKKGFYRRLDDLFDWFTNVKIGKYLYLRPTRIIKEVAISSKQFLDIPYRIKNQWTGQTLGADHEQNSLIMCLKFNYDKSINFNFIFKVWNHMLSFSIVGG